ncbi:MAG: helix-turn-helix domain-containing protein [Pseudomonadota bacterium]
MNQEHLSIGVLSTLTQCTVPTIRYYERIGLLPDAQRSANTHRFYQQADLRRLVFIKRCRDFGFPIEQVRKLARLFEDGDRACVDVRDVAQMHLDQVRAKINEMQQLERSLAMFVDSCNTACCDGLTRDCTIMEDLSAMSELQDEGASGSCCGQPKRTTSSTGKQRGDE